MNETDGQAGIGERLGWLRRRVFGERGRASLARSIGVSPSTYNYYEKGRQPPADLLARAAQVTGADLRWLLTGAGAPFPETTSTTSDTRLSQAGRGDHWPVPEEAAPRLQAPGAGRPCGQSWPRWTRRFRPQASGGRRRAPVGPKAIPIVGRTAAGLPAAWERYFAGQEDPQALERLIRHVEKSGARARSGELKAADPASEPDRPRDAAAMLVQLSAPTADGIVEYLELPGLPQAAPGTFALRVDGDSMAPRILDGDMVVCRRGVPPQAGQTAVVKIRDHIGLTVKLWRPEGDRVHLIPINEMHPQRVFSAGGCGMGLPGSLGCPPLRSWSRGWRRPLQRSRPAPGHGQPASQFRIAARSGGRQ